MRALTREEMNALGEVPAAPAGQEAFDPTQPTSWAPEPHQQADPLDGLTQEQLEQRLSEVERGELMQRMAAAGLGHLPVPSSAADVAAWSRTDQLRLAASPGLAALFSPRAPLPAAVELRLRQGTTTPEDMAILRRAGYTAEADAMQAANRQGLISTWEAGRQARQEAREAALQEQRQRDAATQAAMTESQRQALAQRHLSRSFPTMGRGV